jgi:hypothetical protein
MYANFGGAFFSRETKQQTADRHFFLNIFVLRRMGVFIGLSPPARAVGP